MSAYELMLLTRSELDESARGTIIDRAKDAVTKGGGSWGEVTDWGRRKTAYPIEKLEDAHYTLARFEGDGATVAEAVRVLRITDGVLRVMATAAVPPYPEDAELERISDEEAAAGPKDRGRGGRGGRGGGRGRDRDRD